MTQCTKADLVRHYRQQYLHSSKKNKGLLLQELVRLTGYSRMYLIHALNKNLDIPKQITRERVSRYEPIIEPLEKLWAISNFLCGKSSCPNS